LLQGVLQGAQLLQGQGVLKLAGSLELNRREPSILRQGIQLPRAAELCLASTLLAAPV
jgi:hypothetical protein